MFECSSPLPTHIYSFFHYSSPQSLHPAFTAAYSLPPLARSLIRKTNYLLNGCFSNLFNDLPCVKSYCRTSLPPPESACAEGAETEAALPAKALHTTFHDLCQRLLGSRHNARVRGITSTRNRCLQFALRALIDARAWLLSLVLPVDKPVGKCKARARDSTKERCDHKSNTFMSVSLRGKGLMGQVSREES